MKDKKIKEEVKKGTDKKSELQVQIKKAKEEFANLQLDQSQRKLKNTTSLTLKRKEIARLLTAKRQIEITESLTIAKEK